MVRSTSWPFYAMVTVCSIHCGGSREPLVEPTKRRPLGEAGAAASGAGACLRETGVAIGVAVSSSHISEPRYSDTVAREFAGLTLENELKWDATESSPSQFTFAAADTLVRFAERRQMNVGISRGARH